MFLWFTTTITSRLSLRVLDEGVLVHTFMMILDKLFF